MSDIRKYSLIDAQYIVNKYLSEHERLQLIEILSNEFKLKEITEFAKDRNLNDKTVRNRLAKKKLPNIVISKTTFIISKYIV